MGKRSDRLRSAVIALLAPGCMWCGRTGLEIPDAVDAGDVRGGDANTGGVDSALDATAPESSLPDSDTQPDTSQDDASPIDGSDAADEGPPLLAAPRPVAPLSTATVTSQTPLLQWVLANGQDGAEIDICRDRACTTRVATFMAAGSSVVSPTTLTQGVYFWRLRGTTAGVVASTNSPIWELFVGPRSAAQNTSWGSTLDVNGDGFADVVVGAPSTNGTNGMTTNAYLYLGGAGGLSTTLTSLSFGPANEYHREPIASAGDIDGDGFADVIVGTPYLTANSGAVLVFTGGAGGLSTTPTRIAAPSGVDASFGSSVSSAGDVNGDGYADVIVGAPDGPAAGAILYYGSAGGLLPMPTVLASAPDPQNAGSTVAFGQGVAGAGDVNGDGFGDIVLGTDWGRDVFVFTGGASGLSTTPTVIPAAHFPDQLGQSPGFGQSVACAGDVNGDGFADVLIGAPGDGDGYNATGSTYVYLGAASGLSMTAIALANPTADSGAAFGALVAGAGDVDGDGYADMLSATETESYVFFGGPNMASTLPILLTLPGGEDLFGGGALAGAGDVNGDGFSDVLAGSPDSNNYMGGAFVYLGSSSGPGGPIALTNPGVTNGLFGNSLAIRLRLSCHTAGCARKG